MADDDDFFEPLFNLEDQFYNEGYQLGVIDGTRDGRLEGRAFGIEKGFEKFAEMGRLHGRSLVWNARLPKSLKDPESPLHEPKGGNPVDATTLGSQARGNSGPTAVSDENNKSKASFSLPPLPDNPRLEKHIHTLMSLTDPAQLSFENNEDAVSDFDDRLKRAKAKIKIIEKIVHEAVPDDGPNAVAAGNADDRNSHAESHQDTAGAEGNIEDPTQLPRTLGRI